MIRICLFACLFVGMHRFGSFCSFFPCHLIFLSFLSIHLGAKQIRERNHITWFMNWIVVGEVCTMFGNLWEYFRRSIAPALRSGSVDCTISFVMMCYRICHANIHIFDSSDDGKIQKVSLSKRSFHKSSVSCWFRKVVSSRRGFW